MTATRARSTAERVARGCIPELAERPLYIIQPQDGSILTSHQLGAWGGFFSHGLAISFRSELEARGEWRGDGVAVVVDADRAFAEGDADNAERFVVGLTLHELAHWLDRPEQELSTTPTESFDTLRAESIEATSPTPATKLPEALWGHGASFIRLSCHLWYRTCYGLGGYYLKPSWLQFGHDYCGLELLSQPGQYIETLWAEVQEHRHRPLRTIGAMEQPAMFAALWNADLARVFDAALAARAAA